ASFGLFPLADWIGGPMTFGYELGIRLKKGLWKKERRRVCVGEKRKRLRPVGFKQSRPFGASGRRGQEFVGDKRQRFGARLLYEGEERREHLYEQRQVRSESPAVEGTIAVNVKHRGFQLA